MAKHEKPKLTADEIRTLLAGQTLDESNRQKLARELKAIESAADAARIDAIKHAFGDKHDAARDHCISHGFATDVAAEAFRRLEAKLGWRSPLGSVFGREPDDEPRAAASGPVNVSAPTPQSPDSAVLPQGRG